MRQDIFYKIMRIKFLLVFMLLLSAPYTFGQRNLRYKDVYKVVTEKSKEEAYSILLVHQKQDPEHANTYFQLGLIAQYWSKDYDALTNLRDVELFIYNTGLYFGLANSKIDAKEIRKNDKYYVNVERLQQLEKLTEEEVKAFTLGQIAANNEYKKNVYIVTKLFNSSIMHYNKCISIFKDINTKNNKIKDIYLTAGDDFKLQLNELESSFDSTIYYLQNYQTAIRNYPIKEYNQKYKLLPIETYRLHGLTSSDFLKDEIPIWDYGTWVKNVKKVINGDIEDLRQAITDADKLLTKNTNFLLETKVYKDDFGLKRVDEKLKFKIGKFDHKPILLDLFKYKENKIDLLAFTKKPINNISDTINAYSPIQKARYYETLVTKKLRCDSLNNKLVNSLTPYDLNKYKDFFDNKYGGEQGLKTYSNNEKSLLNTTLENCFDNYKDFIVKTSKDNGKYDSIIYKNKTIALVQSMPNFENNKAYKYYTTDYKKRSNGDYYITGYTVQKSGKKIAFIAKSYGLEEIEWLKLIPGKSSNFGIYTKIKENGCDVLVSQESGGIISNQVVSFDNSGKKQQKIELNIKGFTRFFDYDDINQQYLLITKGNKPNGLDCLEDDLLIAKIDANTKKTKWQSRLKLKGTFVDVIKMNKELLVFANFTEFKTDSVNYISKAGTGPSSTNSLLIVLDEKGKVKNGFPVYKNAPYFLAKAIKIGSNTLNLVGFKGELTSIEKANNSEPRSFLYMLMDGKGVSYFENW